MEQEERNKQDLQVDQEVYQLIEIGENAKAWQLLGTEVRKEILVTPPFGMQWTVILRHLYPEQDTAAKDRSIDP